MSYNNEQKDNAENKKEPNELPIKDIIKTNKYIKPIAIVTAVIMLLVMFVGNIYKSSLRRMFFGYDGVYNAEVVVNDKQYNKIKKNKAVKDIAYIDVVKYRLCNGAPFHDSRAAADGVRVGHFNKKALDMHVVKISKGRMPLNNKEIIL